MNMAAADGTIFRTTCFGYLQGDSGAIGVKIWSKVPATRSGRYVCCVCSSSSAVSTMLSDSNCTQIMSNSSSDSDGMTLVLLPDKSAAGTTCKADKGAVVEEESGGAHLSMETKR